MNDRVYDSGSGDASLDAQTTQPIWVSEADVRAGLERIKAAPLDPKRGLFGPGSMYWEVNKHAVVYFLGAVQSVQLQLAHPWIATAVFEHSKVMTAPRKRAQLTYIYLWSLIYGDLEMVSKKSLSLYKLHTHVKGSIGEEAGRHAAGSAYAANEQSALLFVHVTAFYTRVKLYEALIRPLTDDERDRFCADAKLYAYCFGIPEEAHPSSWQEVEDYLAGIQGSDLLGRTEPGVTISRFMEKSIPWPLRRPLWTFLTLTLPERTREILGLPKETPGNIRRHRVMGAFFRMLIRVLPGRFAFVPAYHEALRRIAGEREPDRITRAMNRAFLGVPKLVS